MVLKRKTVFIQKTHHSQTLAALLGKKGMINECKKLSIMINEGYYIIINESLSIQIFLCILTTSYSVILCSS